MKRVFSFLALASLMATMSACEKHKWSETSQFFKPHGGGAHEAEGGHGAASAAESHGSKAAAPHKEDAKSFFPEKKE
jgi:hypothetical protein